MPRMSFLYLAFFTLGYRYNLYAVFKVHIIHRFLTIHSSMSGDKEIRTLDPLLARQVLSQLSYIPWVFMIYY